MPILISFSIIFQINVDAYFKIPFSKLDSICSVIATVNDLGKWTILHYPIMVECSLHERDTLYLLGLMFLTDIVWNDDVTSLIKSTAPKHGSLCCSRKLLSPQSVLHVYTSTIRSWIECYRHIWSGEPDMYVETLEKTPRRICNVFGPFGFNQFPRDLTQLPFNVSVNTFLASFSVNWHIWYLDFRNLDTLIYWNYVSSFYYLKC